MKQFAGRVALVTGGAHGIGYGMVRNFLREGMQVVILDWNSQHIARAREQLAGAGATHFICADVGDREQVRAAAAEAVRVFGKIHVLCNNAGIGGGAGGNAEDPDFDDWDRAMRVNLGGVVNGTKIITPLILSHGEGGHIVNTSSMAGIVPLPLPGRGAYMTTKFAVRGFTESLRMSLAPHGIGVSCLFPGGTNSRIADSGGAPAGAELSPMAKAAANGMDPLEVGAAVVKAIRNNARYVLTHSEFRDEVRELYTALDAAFPTDQVVPPARREFEDSRRQLVAQLASLPVKD